LVLIIRKDVVPNIWLPHLYFVYSGILIIKTIKVMTKTELQKLQTKAVMEMLINKYNAYNIDDEMGGRISFFIDSKLDNTFQCEYHRSYQDISIRENVKLAGKGWSVDDINKAAEADQYETLLNKEVKSITTQNLAV
jgi:hypothetical protein